MGPRNQTRRISGSSAGATANHDWTARVPAIAAALQALRIKSVALDGEGVAKRRDRPYRSGLSPDWIKVKNPTAPAATRLIE
jgi:ATP-dependent DNA ligase